MSHRDMREVLLQSHNDSALARAVGVNRSTIQRWRANPDVIPLGKAKLLAKIQGGKLKMVTISHEYE